MTGGVVVSPDVVPIVRPEWFLAPDVTVIEADPALDEPLARAAEAARASTARADITAAVRTMYKQVGLDPTRTRPSSEALLRRVRRGDPLPRINRLVDIINWTSLDTQLPFGLYDADRIAGEVTLRLGRTGEEYAGIRKDVVHVAGRLILADASGPFGNPTSDSARTMVTVATARVLVVVFGPAALPADVASAASALARDRIDRYARA